MTIRAFVFDMDGTVLHTLPDPTAVTNLALERMGFPLHTADEVLTYVGNGAERLVGQACPPDASPEERQQTLKVWQAIYLECGDRYTAPFPGILEALRDLRACGMKTAVLSNKFDAAVHELADHYFPGLLDAARGEIPPTPRKPDPTMLLEMLDEMGVSPEEAVRNTGDSSLCRHARLGTQGRNTGDSSLCKHANENRSGRDCPHGGCSYGFVNRWFWLAPLRMTMLTQAPQGTCSSYRGCGR